MSYQTNTTSYFQTTPGIGERDVHPPVRITNREPEQEIVYAQRQERRSSKTTTVPQNIDLLAIALVAAHIQSQLGNNNGG